MTPTTPEPPITRKWLADVLRGVLARSYDNRRDQVAQSVADAFAEADRRTPPTGCADGAGGEPRCARGGCGFTFDEHTDGGPGCARFVVPPAPHPNGRCTCGNEGRCDWCRRVDGGVVPPRGGEQGAERCARCGLRPQEREHEPPWRYDPECGHDHHPFVPPAATAPTEGQRCCVIKVWGKLVDVIKLYREVGYITIPPTLTMSGADLKRAGDVPWNRTIVRGDSITPIRDAEAVVVVDGDVFDALPQSWASGPGAAAPAPGEQGDVLQRLAKPGLTGWASIDEVRLSLARLLDELAEARRERNKTLAERTAERDRLREALSWALDILDQYDEFLIANGEPRERVYSPTHLAGKAKARAALAAAGKGDGK